MEATITGNPALGFGLALAVGMTAQVLARHLQMPGIVLLLAAGVIFGPDVLDVIHPDELGPAVQIVVGFAVAIILFEGGLNLELRRLREEAKAIRRLVTVGALITGAGGTLAAWLIMGWNWRLAVLFGALVIVTGPTVVTPLLRRLRVKRSVNTILEAEGVLIDPIGAIIAVVALEILFAAEPSGPAAFAIPAYVLAAGGLIGVAGGGLMGLMLRSRRIVPEGLENILVLSLVMALFQISEALLHESGLAAAVAAGMVVGNMRTHVSHTLLEFKEQLTILMIALLFVLLAADVRLAEVQALGWPAVATVAALMLVVRPVQVWLCTIGAELSWRERAFIASMAPRGIVAAAVASLFAGTLTGRGLPGGDDLRALVFVVIAVTVAVHGLTGGLIARLLDVRRPTDNGYVILGANALGLALAQLLRESHPDIVFIDSNPERVRVARRADFQAVNGHGLLPNIMASADPDSKLGCIAITPNEEVNVLWASRVRLETRAPRVYVALQPGGQGLPADNVHDAGAFVLFGRGQPVDLWSRRLNAGEITIERWRCTNAATVGESGEPVAELRDSMLVLTIRRQNDVLPIDDETRFREGDEADIAVYEGRRPDAEGRLEELGWVRVTPAPAPGQEEVLP